MRFHWHVEGGTNSFIPPGAMSLDKEAGVRHVMCEMEVRPARRGPSAAAAAQGSDGSSRISL